MPRLNGRTKADLDVVLEETCKALPHGGDHNVRKKVAEKLLESVRRGLSTPESLTSVAKAALESATEKAARKDRPRKKPPLEAKAD
jgi:hypothetical protein